MEHTWHHWVHFVWLGVGLLVGFGAAGLLACVSRTDEIERLLAYWEEHHAEHHKEEDSIPPHIMKLAQTQDEYWCHYSNGWIVLRQRAGEMLISSLVAKVVTEVDHREK